MDVTTFQCPHCHAALRMRGRQTAGTRFRCPDCHESLQIAQTDEGQLSISRLAPAPEPKPPSILSRKTADGIKSLRRGTTYLAQSPVLMSWVVAGTGGLLILLLILLDNTGDVVSPADATTVVETDSESVTPADAGEPATDPPLIPELAPEPEELHVQPKPAAPENLVAAKPEPPPLVARKPQPVKAPAPSQTDVKLALQIPILEFRQQEEIPLKTLIAQFEEMLDTEFEIAENVKSDPGLLDTPVSFSQKNTTLSRLLAQILSEGALTFSVKSNKIYIDRAEAP